MSTPATDASPNEKARRTKLARENTCNSRELAKKAQIESQLSARLKARKRKEMSKIRAEKRKREVEEGNAEAPSSKKVKTEGRIIDFTDRDFEYIKALFQTNILYFGCAKIVGLVCGYDAMFCPALVYPILVAPPEEKSQPIHERKYILGVGKASHIFTGIRQAFTELYPQYPADRVYDWKLMKWNKKVYKAVTVNVAEDPHVLFQNLYSSKSFGGAKHLPAIKVSDELNSVRKMECVIEVAKYIKNHVPANVLKDFPGGYELLSFASIKDNLQAASEKEKQERLLEEKASEQIAQSDIVKETFTKIENQRTCGISDEDTEEENEDTSSEHD